jgi:hypothetical protein
MDCEDKYLDKGIKVESFWTRLHMFSDLLTVMILEVNM